MPVRSNYSSGEPGGGRLVSTLYGIDMVEHSVALNKLENNGIVVVAAPTGSAATDTANIQAAHTALPATGGTIQLQAGAYSLNSTGLTFTKQVRMVGTGGWGSGGAGTALLCSSTTATAITCTAGGSAMEHFWVANNGSLTATSGWGIKFQATGNCYCNRVWVYNFFDGIRMENTSGSGTYWIIESCFFNGPVRYGLFVSNAGAPDSGDGFVLGCHFDATGVPRATATSAVRWESSGGIRIADCKINGNLGNGAFNTGVDFAVSAGAATADLFVQDGSIENIGVTGIKFSRQSPGSGTVGMVHVQGVEMMGIQTMCVDIGAGFTANVVSGNTFLGAPNDGGIIVRAGAGQTVITGDNIWWGINNPVTLEAGVSPDTRVEPQRRDGNGFTVIDGSLGGAGKDCPWVDKNYKRAVTWTVTSTPVTLWTLGTAPNMAGIVSVAVAGIVNGIGGAVLRQEWAYTVNGSGVVTMGTPVTTTAGSTRPLLTASVSTNTIALQLATSPSTDMVYTTAEMNVIGAVAYIKVGA